MTAKSSAAFAGCCRASALPAEPRRMKRVEPASAPSRSTTDPVRSPSCEMALADQRGIEAEMIGKLDLLHHLAVEVRGGAAPAAAGQLPAVVEPGPHDAPLKCGITCSAKSSICLKRRSFFWLMCMMRGMKWSKWTLSR